MRYGVKDWSTLLHLTFTVCATELLRCIAASAGLNFLSLQSNKYGYRPIPKYIRRDLFEERLAAASSNLKDNSLAWYKLDTNSQIYVLRDLKEGKDANEDFWSVMPAIRSMLEGVPFDEHLCPGLLVGRSVSEWEAVLALSDPSNAQRCHWIRREFSEPG